MFHATPGDINPAPTLVQPIGDTALFKAVSSVTAGLRLSNKTRCRQSRDNEFSFYIPAIVANAVGNWLRPLFGALYAPRESLTNPPSTRVSGDGQTLQAEDKQIDIISIPNTVRETRAEIVKV